MQDRGFWGPQQPNKLKGLLDKTNFSGEELDTSYKERKYFLACFSWYLHFSKEGKHMRI